MPKDLMIEQLHISVFVRPGIPESTAKLVRQALNADRLWNQLRRTVQDALEPHSESVDCRIVISH